MADLRDVEQLVAGEHGLAVVSTERADGSVQSSVVNGGVMAHPVSGEQVVGFVARSATVKLANLRRSPRATVVFRVGWRWLAVEGPVDLVGPDDPADGFDAADLPALLRQVFVSAGGTHDNWEEYDRVMAEERRTAAFVKPERIYGYVPG